MGAWRWGACHWSRRTSPQPFAPRGKGRFARVRGARQSADWLRPRPHRAPVLSASVRRLRGRTAPHVARARSGVLWASALAAAQRVRPGAPPASAPQTQARRPAAERARAPMTGTSARNGRTRPIPVEVRPVSGNEGRGRSESAWTPKRQGVKAICRLPNPRDARRNMRLRKSLDRRKPDAPLRRTRHPHAPHAPPTIARTLPTAADRLTDYVNLNIGFTRVPRFDIIFRPLKRGHSKPKA